eukprot:scaffold925_cov129-Cylindrotheca_fusiformis.AAC.26
MRHSGRKIDVVAFLVALIAFQCDVQGHLFVSKFRGGSLNKVNTEESKTAKASLAIIGRNVASTPSWLADSPLPAFFSFNNHDVFEPSGCITNLPNDSNCIETLAFFCDVLVVMETGDDDELEQILTSVRKGASRRSTSALEKGMLLIVTTSEQNSSKLQELVESKLAGDKLLFHSIDTIPVEALEAQSLKHLGDANTIETIFPGENNMPAFTKLLYTVYRSDRGPSEAEFRYRILERLQSPKARRHLEQDPESGLTSESIQTILSVAQAQIVALELKLENAMLGGTSNEMPLLEFSNIANGILDEAVGGMNTAPPSFRCRILAKVVNEVERLYKDYVQLLRDYYGKRYEIVLESKEDESEWAAAAEHMTQGFQAAVKHGVPTLCQSGNELSEIAAFDSLKDLNGLIDDMMEATKMRKEELSSGLEESDEETDGTLRSRIVDSIPPWMKKLAGRALVLGVNYIQGWLAWQGLKRAAAERDRNMPKFPLF